MIRVEEGTSYFTNSGDYTGKMKHWPNAGYYTAPEIPGKCWDRNGECIRPKVARHVINRFDLSRRADA